VAHSQTIDFVRAVKLRGTRSGAAPPANCRSHKRSAGRVHGDHLRAETPVTPGGEAASASGFRKNSRCSPDRLAPKTALCWDSNR